MAEAYLADEREVKLTSWVRSLVGRLRSELELTKGELKMVTEENERLRNVVESKYSGTEDGSDTFLVNQDTGVELPLGEGPTVRFGDFYGVRYDHDETGSGVRVLIVETDDPLQIRPTGARDTIIIMRA